MVNNFAEKRNRTVSWIGRPIRQREMSDGTTNIQVLVEERRTLPVRWSETAASDLGGPQSLRIHPVKFRRNAREYHDGCT